MGKIILMAMVCFLIVLCVQFYEDYQDCQDASGTMARGIIWFVCVNKEGAL